jgi:hypothetical protein
MFLRNYWYVAATDAEISHKPLGRMILGEPIVLFRAEDGIPVASSLFGAFQNCQATTHAQCQVAFLFAPAPHHYALRQLPSAFIDSRLSRGVPWISDAGKDARADHSTMVLGAEFDWL